MQHIQSLVGDGLPERGLGGQRIDNFPLLSSHSQTGGAPPPAGEAKWISVQLGETLPPSSCGVLVLTFLSVLPGLGPGKYYMNVEAIYPSLLLSFCS